MILKNLLLIQDLIANPKSITRLKNVEERDTYELIGNTIEYKDGLTSEQRKRVTHSYLSESIEGLSLATPNPTIHVPLRFKNVCPGCANNVKVGVNHKGAVCEALDP